MKKSSRKFDRRLSLSGLVLAVTMLTGCSILPKAILHVTLPKGPYSYSIQIENLYGSHSLSNPEEGDWWINWGEKEGSWELENGVSYRVRAKGFDMSINKGGVMFLRYISPETYSLWGKPGEHYDVEFTMPTTN